MNALADPPPSPDLLNLLEDLNQWRALTAHARDEADQHPPGSAAHGILWRLADACAGLVRLVETGGACAPCAGSRWVCEAHPDRPSEPGHECDCGAPMMRCPTCAGGAR